MNDDQLLRYSRHIMLEGFDYAGQQRLLDAKVLIIGLGGLGSPLALYLAAAGVGKLWLADFDDVEVSNLQRQIIHTLADVDRPKVISAAEAIGAISPDTQLQAISEKLTGQLLVDAVSAVDLIIDGSDSFSTRFEVNRACVAAKKPLLSGAAVRSEGQLIMFDSRDDKSPCYHCLYHESADNVDSHLNCAASGVLAPLVGVIGSMMALEAVKILSDFGQPLLGQLMIFDAKVMEWRKLTVPKKADCQVCA